MAKRADRTAHVKVTLDSTTFGRLQQVRKGLSEMAGREISVAEAIEGIVKNAVNKKPLF